MDAVLVILSIAKGLTDNLSLFPEYDIKSNKIQLAQTNEESNRLVGKMWIYKAISWLLLLILFIGAHSINTPPVEFMVFIWALTLFVTSMYMNFKLNKLAKEQDIVLDTQPHRRNILGFWGIGSTLILEILMFGFYFMYLMVATMPAEIKKPKTTFQKKKTRKRKQI